MGPFSLISFAQIGPISWHMTVLYYLADALAAGLDDLDLSRKKKKKKKEVNFAPDVSPFALTIHIWIVNFFRNQLKMRT